MTASGPGGEAVAAPLARTGDAFSGDLKLSAPGTWRVALSTQLGSVTAALANVPLDVVDEDGAQFAARAAHFVLAAFSIVAGLRAGAARRAGLGPLVFAYARET